MALIDFIQVERVIIPNLKIQETINYVTYYFEKLEKYGAQNETYIED